MSLTKAKSEHARGKSVESQPGHCYVPYFDNDRLELIILSIDMHIFNVGLITRCHTTGHLLAQKTCHAAIQGDRHVVMAFTKVFSTVYVFPRRT